jgi:hypothetical protein
MKASVPTCRRRKRSKAIRPVCIRAGGFDDANKNGAPCKGRAVFFWQQSGAVAARRRRHQYMLNDSGDGEKASGKKIPAFRRANDTPFNVSERSTN